MNYQSFTAGIFLIITAMIWGLSYSAQSKAMDHLPPLFFVALRYLIAGVFVLILYWGRQLLKRKEQSCEQQEQLENTASENVPDKKAVRKFLLIGGVCCGFCLAGGEILQQFGLCYTTAGKTGFLTALYVIMIPVIGMFIHKKAKLKIWIAAVISLLGSFALCYTSDFGVIGNKGDVLVILCALFFAFQFIAIAKFAPEADALILSAIQFFTVAVISGILAFAVREQWTCQDIVLAAGPLIYCGIIAIGIACTIQVAAQKYVHPATASIILSMASVFAVIFGVLFLGERYSALNLVGCALILAAVIMVQLPEKKED